MKAQVHHFPGREFTLDWLPDDIPGERELARVVIEATAVLGTVLEPLSADLALQCCNAESRFAQGNRLPASAFHHLCVASLPAGVRTEPFFVETTCSTAAQLDGATLQSWIDAALAQPGCGPDGIVCWEILRFGAVRGWLEQGAGPRLLLADAAGRQQELVLEQRADGHWVAGPTDGLASEPPIAVSFHNEGGTLRLQMSVHWSCWTDSQFAGTGRLVEAFKTLRSKGWEPVE